MVAPTSAALAGTAWAVSHTPELVVHNGRVVDTESFGHALLNGVAGVEFPRFDGHLGAASSGVAGRMSAYVIKSWREEWVSA